MLNSFFFQIQTSFVQVKFYSNFVQAYGEFVLTLTVCLLYFIQHGFHVMVFNFGTRSHFTFIDCMFYNILCS